MHNCDNCRFRQYYERRPASLLGRLWHWHAGWCPGWRRYMHSLPAGRKQELAAKYNMQARFGDER